MSRVLTWVGRMGVTLLASALGAGLVHAVAESGRPPGIAARDHQADIHHALERGDVAEALRQMRLTALLRVDDPLATEPTLRLMAETAHAAGDPESELFALRRLLWMKPADRAARVLASSALLDRPGRTMDDLKEAARHAEIAVQLDPQAVTAWLNLARINDAIGHHDQAQALRARAARASGGLDFRVSAAAAYWEAR